MLSMIKGERIHFFKSSHPPGMFTAFYEEPVGKLRAKIRVQLDTGAIVNRIVHVDQIEKWKPEREKVDTTGTSCHGGFTTILRRATI